MSEQWRDIPGYEGLYRVSNLGAVKSLNYQRRKGVEHILSPSDGRGYKKVELHARGSVQYPTVHGLVMLAFVGPRSAGHQVNHKNGIKTDNRLENLEYCTPSQNKKHAFATGLQSNSGEKSSQAKLSDEKVIEIRRRYANGETQTKIATEYGVDSSCISNAVRGRNWSHIPTRGRVIQSRG